jgi:hypothetical protein
MTPAEIFTGIPSRVLTDLDLTPIERDRVEKIWASAESGTVLDSELDWLLGLIRRRNSPSHLWAFVARYWEYCALGENDAWHLTRASSAWRAAARPDLALEALEGTREASDYALLAAAHTTRGGAFRDQGLLESAEREAKRAIEFDSRKPHAFNLLAALAYQKHDFAAGDAYLAEAQSRGGSQGAQREIRATLEGMDAKDRKALIEHLLLRDPQGYRWARGLLGQTDASLLPSED